MSTVEPTEEGKPQPKRNNNQEYCRLFADCLQWAIEKASGSTYVVQTPRVKVKMENWVVGFVQRVKDHVSGKNKKQPDGSYARQPQVRLSFQLLENLGILTCGLKHAAACYSTANFSWGPFGAKEIRQAAQEFPSIAKRIVREC